MEKLKHFETNTNGKDYVVGDLHGCYVDLLDALDKLNFNVKVDRLISVGDLIDRGPDSLSCAQLIYEPWFFAVQGNHESMMCQCIAGHFDACRIWYSNGGMWAREVDDQLLRATADDLGKLPTIITVGEGQDRFNIVHAELFHRIYQGNNLVTDEIIDSWDFSEYDEYAMLWGRTLISTRDKTYHDAEKMSLTFVGHTPLRSPLVKQRLMYIDTGAVFYHVNVNKSEQLALTFACPKEKVLYSYNMMHKTITTKQFDEVRNLDVDPPPDTR